MATGWTVLVAFDAGNLLPVAENWRKAHPGDVMVICGDDDRWNDENTGRAHAENCGLKVYAQVVFPTFEDTNGHPTDWNDLLVAEGLETVRRQLLQSEKANRIRLEDWSLAAYAGEPRERKWIVENVIPAGVAFVLAAMGDAGKGMLMLDLALKVAGKVPLQSKTDTYDFNPELTAFGNPIRTQGKVVMLLAEDDRDEVQRRLHGIGLGKAQNLFIIPLPNTGGPMPIIVPGRNGPELTSAWLALRQQIVECKPTLVVLDPLSSFVMADINLRSRRGSVHNGTVGHFGPGDGRRGCRYASFGQKWRNEHYHSRTGASHNSWHVRHRGQFPCGVCVMGCGSKRKQKYLPDLTSGVTT